MKETLHFWVRLEQRTDPPNTECLLSDLTIRPYDFASPSKESGEEWLNLSPNKYRYLGTGTVYRIDGVKQ